MNEILQKLLGLERPAKRLIQAFCDGALIIACFVAAMFLRLESTAFMAEPRLWLAILPVVPVTIVVFARLGLYRAVLRYISLHAMVTILAGVAISAITLWLSKLAWGAPVPRSVPGIYAVLLLLTSGSLRFFMRALFRNAGRQEKKNVIIYGAGEAGRQLAHALQQGREYMPVAFIDDDPEMMRSIVAGRQVYSRRHAAQLIDRHKVEAILLAIPSVTRARRRQIVLALEPLGVKVKTLPGMADIVSGKTSFSELRAVSPEDLLGRDPVPPIADLLGRNIRDKIVLVSGAGGSIGSELCRQIIQQKPSALVLLEVSEFALYSVHKELVELVARSGETLRIEPILGSVQNPGRVRAILRNFGVQTVYHAAAYKHVVLVEENVVEGVRNNVFGTKVLAEAAAELGVENFIMISTDKAVRPTNIMGASKRMAELVCQALAKQPSRTTFSMVRFGNVLGSSGSVIPRFREQIAQGGPVTVTHRDITRFFMTIPEAAQLVIQAGAMARGGDVFVLDMGEPVKIIDLAMSMVRLHGLRPFVVNEAGQAESEMGDIPIRIVGLNKGEKLYEELLIGEDPKGTEHPRIMTATEVSLEMADLNAFLTRLLQACHAFDIAAIQQILLEAPLAYRPTSAEIHDLMWRAGHADPSRKPRPDLRAI